MHHPWSYLAEFDASEAEPTVHARCQLVLRGHLHRTNARRLTYTDKACVEVAAGAAYAGSGHPNAFQWVTIEPATQGFRVHYRVWSDGRWISDRNQVPESPDGIAEFTLSSAKPESRPMPAKRSPFTGLITELGARFSGRLFVDKALDAFLARHDRGFFVLEGEPGIGKTAWAAHITANRQCVHHFNIEAEAIVRTEQCHANIRRQLAERYLGGAAPASPKQPDDGQLLKSLLEEISSTLQKEERVIIVVDALDEALRPESGNNVLGLPKYLPKGVYFILTTRPSEGNVLVTDAPRTRFLIAADSDENRLDIEGYLTTFVQARPHLQQRFAREFRDARALVEEIAKRSEGNFMYLHHVLPEIEHGILAIGDLPYGLAQYYESHWRKMKGLDEHKWTSLHQRTLSVLASVPEPIPLEHVHAFAGDEPGMTRWQIASVLVQWRPFLRVSESEDGRPYYSIYHKSFRDFLQKKDELGEIDLVATHREVASVLRRTFDLWKAGRKTP
jgi:hypothetical protein